LLRQMKGPLTCLRCHRLEDPVVSAGAGTPTSRTSTTGAEVSAPSARSALVSGPLSG